MKKNIDFKKYLALVAFLFLCFSMLSGYVFTTFIDPSVKETSEKMLQELKDTHILYLIIGAIIIHPLGETIFSQFIPIEFLTNVLKKTRHKKAIVIIISSIIFAIGHTYSFNYVIFAFLMGIVLALIYTETKQRYNEFNAMITVFCCHALNNFMGTIPFIF